MIKKKIFLTFFLYIILIYSFFHIEKHNRFNFEIFLNSFKEFDITNDFPIKNEFFESISLLNNNNINLFSLSDKVYKEEYLRFKIIVTNYPKKYDINSTYIIALANETMDSNCITVEKGIFLKIIQCQN